MQSVKHSTNVIDESGKTDLRLRPSWRIEAQEMWMIGRERWMTIWKPMTAILAIFLAFYFLPLGWSRFDNALVEALALAQWYAQEHVILCLLPAFYISGAIAVFISQASVMRYLGAGANKILAYGVASVSGTILGSAPARCCRSLRASIGWEQGWGQRSLSSILDLQSMCWRLCSLLPYWGRRWGLRARSAPSSSAW
jgi:hypothetical protein